MPPADFPQAQLQFDLTVNNTPGAKLVKMLWQFFAAFGRTVGKIPGMRMSLPREKSKLCKVMVIH
jgi:hypothetical protein